MLIVIHPQCKTYNYLSSQLISKVKITLLFFSLFIPKGNAVKRYVCMWINCDVSSLESSSQHALHLSAIVHHLCRRPISNLSNLQPLQSPPLQSLEKIMNQELLGQNLPSCRSGTPDKYGGKKLMIKYAICRAFDNFFFIWNRSFFYLKKTINDFFFLFFHKYLRINKCSKTLGEYALMAPLTVVEIPLLGE